MKKSPLEIVKERFGADRQAAKAALVKAVRDLAGEGLWVERVNADKGLERASNRKLLHLHEVLTEVKERFGSRSGVIDAILERDQRSKDSGLRARLETWPTPRLWDYYRGAKRA